MGKTLSIGSRVFFASYFWPLAFLQVAIGLFAAPAIRAQEGTTVTGQDQYIDPAFEEVYRVGVLEGESWEMFSLVHQVGFDARGNLYAFDDAEGSLLSGIRILVFDASGAFVQRVWRQWRGPG